MECKFVVFVTRVVDSMLMGCADENSAGRCQQFGGYNTNATMSWLLD